MSSSNSTSLLQYDGDVLQDPYGTVRVRFNDSVTGFLSQLQLRPRLPIFIRLFILVEAKTMNPRKNIAPGIAQKLFRFRTCHSKNIAGFFFERGSSRVVINSCSCCSRCCWSSFRREAQSHLSLP